MIKYKPETWNLIFLFKGSIIKRLLGGMIFLTILSTVLCALHFKYKIINVGLSSALPGYMGAALGLLLVFRNNTAYEKWWEARKCLGELVNVSRNFAITLSNLVSEEDQATNDVFRLLIAFPFALKEHLRSGVKIQELKMLDKSELDVIMKARHVPNAIVNNINARLKVLHSLGKLNDMQHYLLCTQSNTLVDVAGKCERIRNTPIPIAYAFLLKFFILVYVLILPFGLMETLGWSVIPLTVILYYIMMSIVLTAEEIEDPFGHQLNDLPVDEITKNIERNVREIVGDLKIKTPINS